MVRCPRCGTEASKVEKEWTYRQYHVKKFVCPKCDKVFMAYYWKGKLNHTIPKGKE